MSSFVKKFVKSGSTLIYFITCQNPAGKDCYYYVISTREKMKVFMGLTTGTSDLNDYGKIVLAGFGNKPDEKVKKDLEEIYGLTSA